MTSPHGTYRVADGSKVAFADALAAWVPIAYDALIEVARRYNRWTTYLELTDRVQEISGIRTKMLIGNWSGQLLEQVARAAADVGEVPLTSLCVHQDGTIGIGYLRAPKAVAVDPDVDVDDLAAEHRLLCYQKYADDLPADGGTPTVTPRVAEARARRATSKRADAEAKLCPIHFVELSTNGLCSFCD